MPAAVTWPQPPVWLPFPPFVDKGTSLTFSFEAVCLKSSFGHIVLPVNVVVLLRLASVLCISYHALVAGQM
jgi:hypothetical protein